VLLLFFFFQAEDGIRDFHVTGVQTCALPILTLKPTSRSRMRRDCCASKRCMSICCGLLTALRIASLVISWNAMRWMFLFLRPTRSEERRVGKEGRSRRAPDQ